VPDRQGWHGNNGSCHNPNPKDKKKFSASSPDCAAPGAPCGLLRKPLN